jgi:hypothetical protein
VSTGGQDTASDQAQLPAPDDIRLLCWQLTEAMQAAPAMAEYACRLLFRFYDASSGSVRVGGHDVRELTLKSLRHAIAQVPQVLIATSPPALLCKGTCAFSV